MSNVADQPLILLPVVETVIGPMVVGSWINWMLMGTLIVQLYYYQYQFPKDKLQIKFLVYIVVVLDLAQTAVTTHLTWFFAIANWSDSTVLLKTTWSAPLLPTFAGLVSGIVQLFYAWRIWVLSRTWWMKSLAILITLIAISQASTAVVASIVP